MTTLERLLEKFQGNAYPAMLDSLGHHLGVSAETLTRLALGFAPIVNFKKGPSFGGWWVIPERDADGKPIGLSLRSQNDVKVMFPGSSHGLIYEVNAKHERGGQQYQNGPENWLRTMDAGKLCPVCQKPDGCLISSEDIADPKAVICIRKKSDQPMKFGYLHIRKPDGMILGSTALADNGGQVICIEGMSDTAAAMDLGFNAVGRPSNLAGMDRLSDLLRGRDVIVVGENDKKPDGTMPGREGMVAAFQTLRKVCRNVLMLMPPENVKDLRAWKSRFKLTREQFLDYLTEHGTATAEELVLDDERPLTIARAYLGNEHKLAGRYTIRRWAGTWYRYQDSKYVPVEDEQFRQPIFAWSHDKHVRVVDAKSGSSTLRPLVANSAMISNLAEAVMSETLVHPSRIPCWINGKSGPDPRDLIIFSNGILHVPAFLTGGDEAKCLLDPTPDLFTTSALPYAFDPTAACPTWKKFLITSLGDDQKKVALLREWFGYCLTPDTSLQKLMFMRGPSGAGKSVVLNTLARLVGEEQAASTSFADLSGSFGIQSLMGKLVCIIPDARTPKYGDSMRGLELLLNIASGDGVQINRKFKDPIERHKLIARISIASNEFLDVPDHNGAMLRRLNVLEFTQSFVGREDFGLDEKLAAETPGIALWALWGLRHLRETGQFTVPSSSMAAKAEWKTSTSPLAEFLEQCCEAGEEIGKDELYDAWQRWCDERRIVSIGYARFNERLRSNASHVVGACYEKGGHKFNVFRGIKLKKWAAKQFLGKV